MKHAFQRWLKFNVVGIAGVFVQLLTLAVLVTCLGVAIMPATLVAVEAAILHNFCWHERWTWSNRRRRGRAILRFVQFNVANGAVSIAGNLLLMRLLVTSLNMNYIAANIAAISACSIFNFLVSEFVVFAEKVGFDADSVEKSCRIPKP
jgi:putative flippase GtrA